LDLFLYTPFKPSVVKNESTSIYCVMSGNRIKKAGASSLGFEKNEKSLQDICDVFYTKLMERFNGIAASFRFFDIDGDN